MKKIKEYIKLMRVKHYLKNILIFLPLIFSRNIFNIEKLIICLLGFISFCLIASVVYIINDIKDIEKDKKHEVKRNRPLPAGTVSIREAIILAIVLIAVAYYINMLIYIICDISLKNTLLALSFITLYVLLNIAYSFGLKNKPIIDIVILVSGFLLRILYGSEISSIEVSNWLYLTVISGSFYMGLGKRRNEIKKQGDKSRDVLKRYNKEFLDKNMYVCVTLCIVFYALWCVDPITIEKMGNNFMVWTVPISMIILMKYSLNVEGDSYGDPVDVLFKDKLLMTMVGIYAIIVFFIMYFI